MYELEFTFEYQTVDAKDVLYALDKCCPSIGLDTEDYSTADQVQAIERGGHITLSGELFIEVQGGSIANHLHDFLIIKTKKIERSKLVEFVEVFIIELKAIQAFIHDYEYYYWQNAEDILLYESDDRSHSHLPKTSNQLPFPLEQTVVDISNNPARFVLRDGYRETVSSPMWISSALVKDKSLLEKIAKLSISSNSEILKLQTKYQPFNSDTGEQIELQNQLRSALYGA